MFCRVIDSGSFSGFAFSSFNHSDVLEETSLAFYVSKKFLDKMLS